MRYFNKTKMEYRRSQRRNALIIICYPSSTLDIFNGKNTNSNLSFNLPAPALSSQYQHKSCQKPPTKSQRTDLPKSKSNSITIIHWGHPPKTLDEKITLSIYVQVLTTSATHYLDGSYGWYSETNCPWKLHQSPFHGWFHTCRNSSHPVSSSPRVFPRKFYHQ